MENKGRVSVTMDQQSIDALTESDVLTVNGVEFVRKSMAVDFLDKYADKQLSAYKEELASLKEENAKLKAFVKKTLDSAKSGLEYFEIQKEVKDLIG